MKSVRRATRMPTATGRRRVTASSSNPKGEYREKTQLLTVKYNKQDRFCFGVGIVGHGDGPAGE